MFGTKLRTRHSPVHPDDARLQAVLRQWHGLEPRAAFESCVWRRIRVAAAAESATPGLWAIARGWLAAEPAWVHAMAATAGLLVGVALALSAPQARPDASAAAPLFRAQALAGAYLTMVSGGAR